MGNPQHQNIAERKAVESVQKDATMALGEVNGVIVPATSGIRARSGGFGGDARPVAAEAQKVMSGNWVFGNGLEPKVKTVPPVNAAKGNT